MFRPSQRVKGKSSIVLQSQITHFPWIGKWGIDLGTLERKIPLNIITGK